MKKLILVLLALTSIPALACKVQEAQFIATIVTLERHEAGCRTYLHAEKVEQFSPSRVCPLVFGEVSGVGIEVGLNENGGCRFEVGEQISGYLVKVDGGPIELEY